MIFIPDSMTFGSIVFGKNESASHEAFQISVESFSD